VAGEKEKVTDLKLDLKYASMDKERMKTVEGNPTVEKGESHGERGTTRAISRRAAGKEIQAANHLGRMGLKKALEHFYFYKIWNEAEGGARTQVWGGEELQKGRSNTGERKGEVRPPRDSDRTPGTSKNNVGNLLAKGRDCAQRGRTNKSGHVEEKEGGRAMIEFRANGPDPRRAVTGEILPHCYQKGGGVKGDGDVARSRDGREAICAGRKREGITGNIKSEKRNYHQQSVVTQDAKRKCKN